MKKPIIGIPMGDPAGIGPEIILKALNEDNLYKICKPVVIGNKAVLGKISKVIGSGLQLNGIAHIAEAVGKAGTID
ncbi:MAG: hypothetical protein R3232_06660, partial [Clostridia bacterium]|nr:hypothetical protein [Clostridia bacterium]